MKVEGKESKRVTIIVVASHKTKETTLQNSVKRQVSVPFGGSKQFHQPGGILFAILFAY